MPVTTFTLKEKKSRGEKIAVLTAYDHWTARLVDEAGVDVVLVGDSLGNVMLGYDTTLPVTMEDMIHHAKAASRAVKNALVVFDMPFMAYQNTVEEAVRNAGRALQEAGCHAVKLEGGREVLPVVEKLISIGIPVMGHVGLTPQSIHKTGGYRVQGKDPDKARAILEDAQALDQAGAFAVVLECIPAPLAARVTESLQAATIGIGAGPDCDGQVLVFHDMFGLTPGKKPRFVRDFGDAGALLREGVTRYIDAVRSGRFPAGAESYAMPAETLDSLYGKGR